MRLIQCYIRVCVMLDKLYINVRCVNFIIADCDMIHRFCFKQMRICYIWYYYFCYMSMLEMLKIFAF
jgi:hypothetical protein